MSNSAPGITIVDCAMGNMRSVAKALEREGARVSLSADPEELAAADGLILPGVGAFPEAMRRLEARGLVEPIKDCAAAGKPLLGICLGMQLLFESSTEHGGAAGLGLLTGTVEPLEAPEQKLPHIGWSPLRIERPDPLLDGIAPGEPFYFVHSFAPRPAADELLASATHGRPFAAVVGRGNVHGAQFHPEKSSAAGLRLLGNFVSMTARAGVLA